MTWTLWIPAGVGGVWFIAEALLPWLQEQVRRLQASEIRTLDRVVERLAEFREVLQAGVLPTDQDWQDIQALPAPWGVLTHQLLQYLRQQGAPLIPTLQRIEASARQERRARHEAGVQTSQARSQIVLALAIAPLAAFVLYLLLPTLQNHLGLWLSASAAATGLNVWGLSSLVNQIDTAVRGGLPAPATAWPAQARCTGEAVLAFLRGGAPPDQAWMLAVQALRTLDVELASAWGRSLWLEPTAPGLNPAQKRLQAWGTGLRRILHVALMEGYSCSERLESALQSFSEDWNFRVLDGVGRTATQALKPLFLCVLPSTLGLLILAMLLEVASG